MVMWQDTFWRHPYQWGGGVRDTLSQTRARAMTEPLDGHLSVLDQFHVEEYSLGAINSEPESLFLQLASRKEMDWVDAIWWFNHLEAGKPREGGVALFEKHRTLELAAHRHPWLLEWKNGQGDRSIQASISGSALYAEQDIDEDVVPAWQHAQFPGKPTIELHLRRDGQSMASLFLSSSSPGIIVTSANSGDLLRGSPALPDGSTPHWLDTATVFYSRWFTEYLLVSPSGKMERRDISDPL